VRTKESGSFAFSLTEGDGFEFSVCNFHGVGTPESVRVGALNERGKWVPTSIVQVWSSGPSVQINSEPHFNP